jgi:hypothetical protein
MSLFFSEWQILFVILGQNLLTNNIEHKKIEYWRLNHSTTNKLCHNSSDFNAMLFSHTQRWEKICWVIEWGRGLREITKGGPR